MLRKVAHAQEGLDFEQSLFASNGRKVGLWTTGALAIVCPRTLFGKPSFETAATQSAKAGFPVFLRPTGGGAVPQGPGCVNLALAFNATAGFTIEDGYRMLTRIITDALGDIGKQLKTGDTPGSFCDGAWNLSAGGRKIVGTAQRWRPVRGGQPRVLAHALLLLDDDYLPGAGAVASFHKALGLHPIDTTAHTSLFTAFGAKDMPVAAFLDSAKHALEGLTISAN